MKKLLTLLLLVTGMYSSIAQCTVNPPATPTVSANNNITATCVGKPIVLTASSTDVGDSWKTGSSFNAVIRGRHGVSFVINDTGYIGTGYSDVTTTSSSSFFKYDPKNDVFTQIANFGGGVRYGAVGFALTNGKGYVGTGGDPTKYNNDFWEYNPAANKWTSKAVVPGNARVYASAFGIYGKGYVMAGSNGTNWLNDMYEYNPTNDTWTSKGIIINGYGARYGAAAFSIGSLGYFGMGYAYNGVGGSSYEKRMWKYDPLNGTNGTWTAIADFPGVGRAYAVAFSIGGKGYVGTGTNGVPKRDFYQYDPAANTWETETDFNGAITIYGATGFGIGSKGYLVQGVNSSNLVLSNIFQYTPKFTYEWSDGPTTNPRTIAVVQGATTYSVRTKSVTGCSSQWATSPQLYGYANVSAAVLRSNQDHTVPYPHEFPNEYIEYTTIPTGSAADGLTFKWQKSFDQIAWTDVTSPTTFDNTFAYNFYPDSSTTTDYRLLATDHCQATAPSGIVHIKVFNKSNVNTNLPSLNGSVTGRVLNKNKSAGIAGITIKATRNTHVKGSPDNYTYTTTTDVSGYFLFKDMFYGDKDNGDPLSVDFTITPEKTNHLFNPPNYSPATISFGTPTFQTPLEFLDTTALTISGLVYQKCIGCLNSSDQAVNTITAGVDSALIQGGEIPVYADTSWNKSGNYTAAVTVPGTKTFTPSRLNHVFSPANRTYNVQDNVVSADFEDMTTRTITGKLAASGGSEVIGTATIEFTDYDTVWTTTPPYYIPYTFRKQTTTNANTGLYTITLPAKKYKSRVVSYTDKPANANTVKAIDPNDLAVFFNDTLKAKKIDFLVSDISKKDTTLNFTYHRAPVMQLVGLRDTTCNAAALGIVFKQNYSKYFLVEAYEGDPSILYKIVTNETTNNPDSLHVSDSIKIVTNVTSKTALSSDKQTYWFRLHRNSTPSVDSAVLLGGAPNIASPYNKQLNFYYTDIYGRELVRSPVPSEVAQRPDRKATSIGIMSPPQTFVTTAPEVPMLILHRPPGDQSFSFWAQNTTFETSKSFTYASTRGGKVEAEVKVGAEFSVGFGVEPKTKIEGSISGSIGSSVTNTTEDELTHTFTTTQQFSTEQGGIFGSAGDVYVGAAVNYKYGVSNVLAFDTTPGTCAVNLSDQLIIADSGFATTFTYSEDHILNTLMPALEYFVTKTTGTQQKFYANQLKVWQQVVDFNTNNKQNARFVENRSFDGSAGPIDVSKTMSQSSSNTISFDLELDTTVADKIGAEVNGIGGSLGATIEFKQTFGQSKNNTKTKETTTGYHLDDQNSGDYYSVDIKTDRVYGTPVFELVAGTSSCPPEPGAQSRDYPDIIVDTPLISNIPLTGKGFFTLKCVNLSQSREKRNYILSINNATTNGLTIRKGGVALGGTDVIPINDLNFLESRPVLISVEKDNPADNITSYPDIEFTLSDACDGSIQVKNTISANFVSPCGNINMVSPEDGWVHTSADGSLLPVTFDGYTYNSLSNVSVQYYANIGGSNVWTTGINLQQANVNATGPTTANWNVASLTDSLYKIRVKLTCTGGGVVYSPSVKGIIDTKGPSLAGRPQPLDGNYVNGDEISFSYNEAIKTSTLSSSNVEMRRKSNNAIIATSVNAFGNKVIIDPLDNIAAYTGDSIMVVVKNIADIYGNVNTTSDTTVFGIGTAPVVVGLDTMRVYAGSSSVVENSGNKIGFIFKLPKKATKLTRVYFSLSGTALNGNDYTIAFDSTLSTKIGTTLVFQKVYGSFNGAQGYAYVDKDSTQGVIWITPVGDGVFESNETVIINLASGGDYNLVDSTSATATIMNDDLETPLITASGSLNLCTAGSSVVLSTIAGNTWTQKANIGNILRNGAVGFSINNKGYFGTGISNNVCQKDFWEFDPITNTWTQKADFAGTARAYATGFSISGKGYVGIGWQNGIGNFYDFWEYEPSGNEWTQKADFGGGERRQGVSFSIADKGYIGTGRADGSGDQKDLWQYEPATNQWTKKADMPGTLRNGAVGFSIGSKGYIGTGNDGSFRKDFYEYNPGTDTWVAKTDFGGVGRGYGAGFSIGNKGYIGGGYDGSGLADVWEYNPTANTWVQRASMVGGRFYTAGFSIGSKGYVGAGADGSSDLNDFWSYTPPNSIKWSTGAITPSITVTSGGKYTVKVTDNATGFSGTSDTTIVNKSNITATFITANSACANPPSGGIQINATGGITPYYYKFDSLTADKFQASKVFKPLKAGIYRVTIKDSIQCVVTTGNITITAPAGITGTFTKTDATCIGKADGTITVTTSGGKAPYGYKVGLGGNYNDGNVITGLKAGTYTIYVKDVNGCIGAVGPVTVGQVNVTCLSKTAIASATAEQNQNGLALVLTPNPTNQQFTLRVFTENKQAVQLRVLDVNGKTLYTTKGFPEQAFKFGEAIVPGTYLVEVRQGETVKTVKAVKMR